MTSPARAAANRRNALQSTGPTSAAGRARSSRNALSHGLRAASTVTPIESRAEWEAHLAAVLEDLAPVGYLEESLAVRVAELLWRLRRVMRAEAASVAKAEAWARRYDLGGEDPEDVSGWLSVLPKDFEALDKLRWKTNLSAKVSRDEADRVALALFEETAEEAFGSSGPWTVESLQSAVEKAARENRTNLDTLLSETSLSVVSRREEWASKLSKYREALGQVHVPGSETVARYETSLERSLFRTLHELERLQARRSGAHVPPPVVADLDVSVSQREA